MPRSDPETTLLAVPNVSDGGTPSTLAAIGEAFASVPGARLLTAGPHSDPDHGRSVFTLAGPPRALADALVAGAREAVARVDLTRGSPGLHPHVGALDVVPVVHLDHERRGAACAEALVVADRLADELELPVFLYGLLAGGRTRAELRRGGPQALADRMLAGKLTPDFGPPRPHPTAGAALVAARPPLVALNLELSPPASVDDARRVAALVREGGADGLPGVRAIGLGLGGGAVAQVSCNVEDHERVPLVALLAAVRRHASVDRAELVGLAPRSAFEGWPDDVPIRNLATIEDALR